MGDIEKIISLAQWAPSSCNRQLWKVLLINTESDKQFLTAYFGNMLRKVEPYMRDAFPRWAVARGLGGLVTVGLTLLSDGRVAHVRVVRSSGIDEYDKNVLEVVKRAAPYGPLPPELAASPLAMRLCFDSTNPAVGRSGPGPGQWHP